MIAGMRPATLAAGLWRDGACHRDALIRPLTGHDLARAAASLAPNPSWVIDVLAQQVTRVGGVTRIDRTLIRELVIGDCALLLLVLRASGHGALLQWVESCASCGEALDAELDSGTVLSAAAASEPLPPPYSLDDGPGEVRYRLATAGDLEEAAANAALSDDGAARALLAGCTEPADSVAANDVLLHLISDGMAARDPFADVSASVACPACGSSTDVQVDVATFFRTELRWAGAELDRDIHRLALNYHWTERDILAMPSERRRMFLELLEDDALVGVT
jgi:hypothetical protein